MKKDTRNLKISALASTAALLGAVGTTNAADLLSYKDLGTGAELRSSLINIDATSSFLPNAYIEMECGEGKCGEGKCGDDKDKKGKAKPAKKETKAETKPASSSKGEMKSSEKGTMRAEPAKPAKKEMKEEKSDD